jgi:hypothetical protein
MLIATLRFRARREAPAVRIRPQSVGSAHARAFADQWFHDRGERTEMIHRPMIGLAIALCLMLSAFQSSAQNVQNKEDMLAAAGFVAQPANTPRRLAALRSLPPHKFVRHVKDNKTVYVYADPTICGCVYFGSQDAYARYRSNVLARQMANEDQVDASLEKQAYDLSAYDTDYR